MRLRRTNLIVAGGLAIACVWAAPRLSEHAKQAPAIFETGAALTIPANVARIFTRSCADCHSNQTRWPWYSKVPPASWIVSKDVNRGRKAMNLSEWSVRKNPSLAATMLLAACADMQSGRMPLQGYLLLHPDRRPTSAEINTVCQWTTAESRRILEAERLRKKNLKPVSKVEYELIKGGNTE